VPRMMSGRSGFKAGPTKGDDERRRLWDEYETAMWTALAAVSRQGQITQQEIKHLAASHRRTLRVLNRLAELTAGT
jgi:hypothetical protein